MFFLQYHIRFRRKENSVYSSNKKQVVEDDWNKYKYERQKNAAFVNVNYHETLLEKVISAILMVFLIIAAIVGALACL